MPTEIDLAPVVRFLRIPVRGVPLDYPHLPLYPDSPCKKALIGSIAPFTPSSKGISCFFKNSLAVRFLHSVESPTITSFPLFSMSYVVASKVKELLKKSGMMSSGDLAEASSKLLEEALKKAVARAKENGRKTVRPCDL